jgi:hypothetical protein
MPTYDARPDGPHTKREPGAIQFPVPVRIVDPSTGKRIPNVFYCRTNPPQIGRFLVDADGNPLARSNGRKIAGKRMDLRTAYGELIAKDKVVAGKMVDYERWDVFEERAWVAVSLATGEVVAKSEGTA